MDNFIEVIKYLSFVLPSILTWFLIKPTELEMKINRMKDSLRNMLRIQVSYDLAKLIPLKVGTNSFEEAFQNFQIRISEYLSATNDSLKDYIKSKQITEQIIFSLRLFKYLAIIMPMLGVAAFLALYTMFHTNFDFGYYLLLLFLLLLSIGTPLLVMERNKDKLLDLINKYEISNNEKLD
jgi:hypothetical protein